MIKVRLLYKLLIISIVSGSILAGFLKIVQLILNDDAYILLFNMDYIPLLKNVESISGSGYIFHFVFCFVSIAILFLLAKIVQLEQHISTYVIVFTVGSGMLYFLTALTNQPPSAKSVISWIYWTVAHAIFGIVVGVMIKYWLKQKA